MIGSNDNTVSAAPVALPTPQARARSDPPVRVVENAEKPSPSNTETPRRSESATQQSPRKETGGGGNMTPELQALKRSATTFVELLTVTRDPQLAALISGFSRGIDVYG